MIKKIKNIFNPISLPVITLIGIFALGGIVTFFVQKEVGEMIQEPAKEQTQEEAYSPQEIAEKAINFINEKILSGEAKASLVNVIEEKEVYKIRLKIGEQEYDSYLSKDGKFLFPEGIDLDIKLEEEPKQEEEPKEEEKPKEQTSTIGNFSVSSEEVCKEDGKPIVYFFGSESCPHCVWEHPLVEMVVEEFEGYISSHNNMDSQYDMDVFQKYSTGGIPTLVLGCKYYRVGSGEASGAENEINNLIALICKLTGNQPSGACSQVEDLISQID